MSNPIIAADGGANAVHEFSVNPKDGRPATVVLQGDQNDFTWELQISLDGGTTWTAMEDSAGNTSFTGCAPKSFDEVDGADYRVEVTSLGTATAITVATN